MAAAARAPGPADARIPCPRCGGLIHPIAGRCKHCKEDLSTLRSSRPAAAASLPALLGEGARPNPYAGPGGYPVPPAGPAAQLHAQAAQTHPANAHLAVPIAMRTEEPSQAILPPRPTGRMSAAPRPVTWKSWPVIVIAIAVVAIVAAVILMVLPPSSTKANAGTLPPPPAPERMDTNPLPPSGGALPPSRGGAPQGGLDPWNDRPGAAPDPAPTRPAPPTTPDLDDLDDLDPDDPGSLRDPFGSLGGRSGRSNRLGGLGGRGGLGSFNGRSSMALTTAFLHKACERLASCGNTDRTMAMACEAVKLSFPDQPPPSCAAAQRCLAHVDRLSCTDDLDALALTTMMSSIMTVQDCIAAAQC